MKPKISLITLGVTDLPRAQAFYEALGFAIDGEPSADFALFEGEGTRLALFPRQSLAEDATVPAEGTGFRGMALAHNEPSREGVDAVLAEAIAAGATLIKPAHETFWGGYSGYFADPDGHLWEVAWNPFTDLT